MINLITEFRKNVVDSGECENKNQAISRLLQNLTNILIKYNSYSEEEASEAAYTHIVVDKKYKNI